MRLPALYAFASLALLLAGCAEQNALQAAQAHGTPEAYDAFLAQFPSSPHAPVLRQQIEDLRYSRAKNGTTADLWRDYLTNHPEGKNVKAAKGFEDELSFQEAVAARTAESLQGYLDSHPTGKFVPEARAELDELGYLDRVAIEGLRVEQVNLANDPQGPKNGWGFYADVKNNGDRIVTEVELRLVFESPDGKDLGERIWWAVAPGLVGMPTPPRIVPPLRPGDTRPFEFTTGAPPEGWADRFRLEIVDLRFRS